MMNPRRRSTDVENDVRTATILLRRYSWLWIPLSWLVIQIGFGIVTPRATTKQIRIDLDTTSKVFQREITAIRESTTTMARGVMAVHATMQLQLDALRRYDCIDHRVPMRDKLLIGLRCEDILQDTPAR